MAIEPKRIPERLARRIRKTREAILASADPTDRAALERKLRKFKRRLEPTTINES